MERTISEVLAIMLLAVSGLCVAASILSGNAHLLSLALVGAVVAVATIKFG